MAVVLVTGASTGLGLATANELADAGHDVVLHARNPGRLAGEKVSDQVTEFVYADLSDRTETARLAEQIDGFGRLDAVIHNAGILDGPAVFAVNIVAPYLLTALLTPPKRMIVLSSSMHRSGSPDLDTLDLADAGVRRRPYDDSKLYVTALAMALARLRPDAMAHAVDPGWVPTRMGGRSAPDSLVEGHRTQTWLATAEASAIEPRTGGYWFHRTPRRPHPAAADPRFQEALLERLAAHTGVPLAASGR